MLYQGYCQYDSYTNTGGAAGRDMLVEIPFQNAVAVHCGVNNLFFWKSESTIFQNAFPKDMLRCLFHSVPFQNQSIQSENVLPLERGLKLYAPIYFKKKNLCAPRTIQKALTQN